MAKAKLRNNNEVPKYIIKLYVRLVFVSELDSDEFIRYFDSVLLERIAERMYWPSRA